MIRIAICEDNVNLANSIENDLLNIAGEKLYCDVYYSGVELVNHLLNGENPNHIYFMDIEMPQQNGIKTASIIREKDKDALIIFITDYKEYVYNVFETLPFRFLQKPVSLGKLQSVLTDSVEHIRRFGQIFLFQIGHEKFQLYYRDIIYFEGAGRKVKIKTERQSFEIYDKISAIYARLDNRLFCRIHASYIVNMEFIHCIKRTAIVLRDGASLPISKKHLNEAKQAHLAFLERRCGV